MFNVTIMLISSTLPPKMARLGPVGGVHQGQVQRGEKRADRGTKLGSVQMQGKEVKV